MEVDSLRVISKINNKYINSNNKYINGNNKYINGNNNDNKFNNNLKNHSNEFYKERDYLFKDDVTISFLEGVINEANKQSIYPNREFEYYIHEDSKKVIVKVMDSETKEVIREIPDEKLLDIIYRIQENIGVMFDDSI